MPTYRTIYVANPRHHRRRKARNQNIITDALVGKITDSVASRVGKMFSSSKRKKSGSSKRRKRGRRNPHLALIGSNPKRKRSTSMARRRRSRRRRNSLRNRPRDSKGRLLKVNKRRRRANPKRRRNVATRANPRRRRRRRNRARVRTVIRYRNRTKIKYRTRRVNVARRRKRRGTRRRSRRRNSVALAAVNPRRRRRRSRGGRRRRYNTKANRRRRYTRRRRNAGLGGLVGRVNFMQVAEVAGGAFIGDKVTTYLGNQVNSMIGVTDPTIAGLVKTGLGIVTAGFVWRFRPALGLGIAVGAANALLNQYVFVPLWGMTAGYLPTGMAGLSEYQSRGWKMDNWLAEGGAGVAGMGQNKLLTKGL